MKSLFKIFKWLFFWPFILLWRLIKKLWKSKDFSCHYKSGGGLDRRFHKF